MSLKDSLIGFMVILIWGFNFVVISWGVHDMPPLLLGTLRFIGLALIGVLFGSGGTEVAYRVSNIAGDVVTYTKDAAHATYPVQSLADKDLFVVKN